MFEIDPFENEQPAEESADDARRRQLREELSRLEAELSSLNQEPVGATPSKAADPNDISHLSMPVDPAADFNLLAHYLHSMSDALCVIEAKSRLPEIVAAAQQIVSSPASPEGHRIYVAARRFLDVYQHGPGAAPTKPAPTSGAITAHRRREHAEAQRKAAIPTYEKFLADQEKRNGN